MDLAHLTRFSAPFKEKYRKMRVWLGFELLAPGLGWPGPGPDLLQRASSSPEHGSRPQDIGF